MDALCVLLPVHRLDCQGGVQSYVRDLAEGLLRAGHRPVVYSTVLGEVAIDLRQSTIAVIDDLSQLGVAPDIINGHCGHAETMAALMHFPGVPGIFTCHGWDAVVPHSPRFVTYVAVDETCRDHLVLEGRIAPDAIAIIPNTVDLARFAPRAPLPASPRRALIFGTAGLPGAKLDAIEEAARSCGVALDVVGWGGKTHPRPETLLGEYDIVFAKARCALEALAVGASVILCDYGMLGPIVKSADVDRLRRLNFGMRAIMEPLTRDGVHERIRAYDAADAAITSRTVREIAGHELAVHAWLDAYREAIVKSRASPPDPAAEGRAAAAYLRERDASSAAWDSLGPSLQRWALRVRRLGERLRRNRYTRWLITPFLTRKRRVW